MGHRNLPGIVGIAMVMALSAIAKEGEIVVLREALSVHFPDGVLVFNDDGRFRKQSNRAQNAEVQAYMDIDGDRRYYSVENWKNYRTKGTLPDYIIARTPQGSTATREYVAQRETRTLNFEVTEEMKPDPVKEETKIRERDFDRLPDYGKNMGAHWNPNGGSSQGKVDRAWVTSASGRLHYGWGDFQVHWVGAEHPQPKWEIWGEDRGMWQPYMHEEFTHEYWDVDGTRVTRVIYHPTKHISVRIWNPWGAKGRVTTEQMERLAEQYFEFLEPYSQLRRTPIERKDGKTHPWQTQ